MTEQESLSDDSWISIGYCYSIIELTGGFRLEIAGVGHAPTFFHCCNSIPIKWSYLWFHLLLLLLLLLLLFLCLHFIHLLLCFSFFRFGCCKRFGASMSVDGDVSSGGGWGSGGGGGGGGRGGGGGGILGIWRDDVRFWLASARRWVLDSAGNFSQDSTRMLPRFKILWGISWGFFLGGFFRGFFRGFFQDAIGILWRFFKDSLRFFRDAIGILWRFFKMSKDSLRILLRIFEDSLRFFWDAIGILLSFFKMFKDSFRILTRFFGRLEPDQLGQDPENNPEGSILNLNQSNSSPEQPKNPIK